MAILTSRGRRTENNPVSCDMMQVRATSYGQPFLDSNEARYLLDRCK